MNSAHHSMIDAVPDAAADAVLVQLASTAMTAKLAKARDKGRGGWHHRDTSMPQLRDMLEAHMHKGDPVDVMNFAGMIYARQQLYGRDLADVVAATPQADAIQAQGRYVRLDNAGRILPADAIGCAGIWDREANLTWPSFFLCNGEGRDWHESGREIERFNAQRHMGFSDWVQPTRKQADTLIDDSVRSPSADHQHFKFLGDSVMWTKTPDPSAPRSVAFVVRFASGAVLIYVHGARARVLAVRVGGPSGPGQ